MFHRHRLALALPAAVAALLALASTESLSFAAARPQTADTAPAAGDREQAAPGQAAPGPAAPETPAPTARAAKEKRKKLADPRFPFAERLVGLSGVENVGRIAPGIYRGNAPSKEGLATLKALGINTVVNLRHYHGKGEEKACREVGLRYVRIVLESSDAPTDESVRRFLRTVTDPDLQPVYFHCWRGKDRTGAMCAIYRMTVDGWPLEAARAEMDEFGFYHGWHDLLSFVKGFPARQAAFWPLDPGPVE